MGRGRTPAVSDERLLIEILLHQDQMVMAGEIAEAVDVTNQTIRERMVDLEGQDRVEPEQVSNRNLYRLTEDGQDYLTSILRERYE